MPIEQFPGGFYGHNRLECHQRLHVKIWAIDDYGNESTVDAVNIFTPPTPVTPGDRGSSCRFAGRPDTVAPAVRY
jgi:hypothetical protein